MNKHPNTDNHSATSKRPDMESASIVMAAVTSSIDDAELHTQPNQDYTQPAIEAQSAIDSVTKLLKEPVTYRTHTDTRLYTENTENTPKTPPHCIQNYPVDSLKAELLALKAMLATPKEERAGKFERSDDLNMPDFPNLSDAYIQEHINIGGTQTARLNQIKTSPKFKLVTRPRNIPLCLSNSEILTDTSCDPERNTFLSTVYVSSVVLLFITICAIYSIN